MAHVLFETVCPFCGQRHDAATDSHGKGNYPENGDVTLCIGCGQFCIFDSKAVGGLRKPTKKEQREVGRDADAQAVLTSWKIVKRQ